MPAGGEPIAAMPPAERRAMIEQMVAGLDQRLKTQGGTIDEWLRLIRSYAVLGDTAQAKSAAALAKSGVPGRRCGGWPHRRCRALHGSAQLMRHKVGIKRPASFGRQPPDSFAVL